MPWMVVAYGLGCVAVATSPSLPEGEWVVALGACGLVALIRRGRWLVVGAFSAGVAFAWCAASDWLSVQTSVKALAQPVVLTGVVTGLPVGDPSRVTFDLRVEHGVLEGWTVRLTAFRSGWQLRAGQRREVRARLRPIDTALSPGLPDRRLRALNAGIVARGTALDGRLLPSPTTPSTLIGRQREWLAEMFGERFAARGHGADLLRALALGDRRGLSPELRDAMARTGTGHLLAVSGLHVALAAGVGFALAGFGVRILPGTTGSMRTSLQAIGALVVAGGYAVFTGFQLPTQRALIMIAAALTGRCFARHVSAWRRLALAAGGILLASPLAVLDPGFWLSFCAVATLLLWASSRGVPSWRDLPRLQLIIAVLMWPLGATWFGQVSLIAPLVNLIAIPWVSLTIMPAVITGTLLTYLSEPVATLPLSVAAWQLHAMATILCSLAAWPGSAVTLAPTSPVLVIVAVGLLATLTFPRGLLPRGPAVMLLATLVLARSPGVRPGEFEAHVLALSRGTATLVRTARHTLLIDAGGATSRGGDRAGEEVSRILSALSVRRIDALVLTEASASHAGGAEYVSRRLRPARTWARSADLAHVTCKADQRWQWDDVEFRFVFPSGFLPVGYGGGCVLLISGAGGRLLVAGDPKTAALDRIAENLLPVPAVMASAHGRADPSRLLSDGGVAVVTPPHRRGARRSPFACENARRCAVLESGEQGMITLRFVAKPPEIQASSWKQQHRRWWR